MFLLSPKLIEFIRRIANCAYFFRVVPFKFQKTQDTVYFVQTSKWNLYKFDVIVYLTLAHYIFMCIRFYQTLSEIDSFSYSDPRLTIYAIEGMYIVTFTVAVVLQLSMFHYREAVPRLMNQCLDYFKSVESRKLKGNSIL